MTSKALFIAIFILTVCRPVHAQPYEIAKKYYDKNDLAKAKEIVEEALDNPARTKDARLWFMKSRIYIGMAESQNNSHPLYAQALEAIEKYYQYDTHHGSLIKSEGLNPALMIYSGESRGGNNWYAKRYFREALDSYTGALDAFSHMKLQGLTTISMDTSAILYAGVSADRIHLSDTAAYYYQMIVNNHIININGNDMSDVYKWIPDYFLKKNMLDSSYKYLETGRIVFPNELYWYQKQLEICQKNGNAESILKKFSDITMHFPENYILFYNYGIALHQLADSKHAIDTLQYDSLKDLAVVNFKKCLEIKPDFPNASLVLAQIHFNAGVDLQKQAGKVVITDSMTKKKSLEYRSQAEQKFNQAIPFCLNVENDFKSSKTFTKHDSTVLFDSYDLLLSIYKLQKDKTKMTVTYQKMGNYFENTGDHEKASIYFKKATE
jgi:Tfp pilus assembly protein PilF